MASPGNQHCANCIGTLSFPIADICRLPNPISTLNSNPNPNPGVTTPN